NDANNQMFVVFAANGSLYYSLKVAGTTVINPGVNGHGSHILPLNRPSLLIFTYGSGGFRAYVDAEADLILPLITGVPASGSAAPVRIGADNNGVTFS